MDKMIKKQHNAEHFEYGSHLKSVQKYITLLEKTILQQRKIIRLQEETIKIVEQTIEILKTPREDDFVFSEIDYPQLQGWTEVSDCIQ